MLDVSPQVEAGETYPLGVADAYSTAVALVFQAKVEAGEDPAEIDLEEIEEDPKIKEELAQAIEEALAAGEDPTTAPEVIHLVDVIVTPPKPTTPTTPSTPVTPTPTPTPTYNITIASVVGGTATVTTDPADAAAAGTTVTVNISDIQAGKQFQSITVTDADGNPVTTTAVTPGSQYTFTMPAKAVTITVTLEDIPVPTYTVTFTITPEEAADATVEVKDSKDNVVDPVTGEEGVYKLTPGAYTYTVSKDGYKDVTDEFTVTNEALTITVNLELVTYTVTLTGEGLTSAPEAGEIPAGTSVTITVTPPEGKQVATFTVNDEDKKADLVDNKYTFTITADTTVVVTYEEIKYTITATAGEGGSIEPSGEVEVIAGEDKTFTITPNEGWQIADVKVDGVSKGAITTYTFENVQEDHTIEATFSDTTPPTLKSLTAYVGGEERVANEENDWTLNWTVGEIVTEIIAIASEPVRLVEEANAVVTMSGGSIPEGTEYGKIRVDETDPTKTRLIITPNPGNETAGLAGTFTFTVAAGVVEDAAGNENEAISIILKVGAPGGKSIYNERTGVCYETIQAAIDGASAGDTIIVAAGTYNETLAIEKSLTLQGESKENTTIDGGGNSPCIRVKASNVVINGFTINNSGDKAIATAILFDYDCTNCNVENCNIITSASAEYGVRIYGSNNITIQNNNISGGTYGVIADQGGSNYIKIKNNTMANLRDGVILQFGTGHEVEGNNISTTLSNSKAIEVHTSDTAVKDNILLGPGSSGVSIDLKLNIVVEGNEISGKTTAIHVGNDALNARVENNILSSNREGIHVQTGPWKEANLNISGNTISNSTVADIYVSGSKGPINIWENDISGGPCGVKIEDSGDRKSTGVSINSNSIHGHTGYGVNNEAVETVDATCNWWGDKSGPRGGEIDPCEHVMASGTGDRVSGNVCFYPWCEDESCSSCTIIPEVD